MKPYQTPRLLGALVAAAAMLTAAQADTIGIGEIANLSGGVISNGRDIVNITYKYLDNDNLLQTRTTGSIYAGAFSMSGTVNGNAVDQFYSFCTDINSAFVNPQNYQLIFPVTDGGNVAPPSWVKPDGFAMASWLYAKYLPDFSPAWLGTDLNAAGLQLALWELLYDSAPGSVANGQGNVYATAGNATAIAAANSFVAEALANGKTFASGTWLDPQGDGQGFLYYPVPEPSTVIAGLLLLAPMGFGVTRVIRSHKPTV
jgi:hypothetical protein